MPLSANGLKAALAEWTEEVFLECLTFTHADLSTPLRLVNDLRPLTRAAGVFQAIPFQVQLHVRSEDSLAEANIRVDNVDQALIRELRAIVGRPEVMYEVVMASSPNVVEYGPMNFEVMGFSTDLESVSLQIAFSLGLLGTAYPKGYFSPSNAQPA